MISEKRKLILFGKNSHIITLPQKWLKEMTLKKGDEILIFQKNKKLIVTPNSLISNREKIAQINFSNKPLRIINKQIISYYLKNYKYIELVGSNLLEKIPEITVLINKLSSVEIVNMEENKIVLEDLSSLESLDISKILKNMCENINLCFENLEDKKKNSHLILDIDKTTNKLMFLGSKKINFLIEENIEENILKLFEEKKIICSLENIGDLIKRISRVLDQTSEEEYNNIEKVITETKKYYLFIMLFLDKNVDYEKNLESYVNKKNSLLILFNLEKREESENSDLFKLISQHLKNIVGELEVIIQALIDMRVK